MSLENCSNEHTIDFIAKSFFVFMISLSLINDAFSLKNTIIENNFVKTNIKKINEMSDIFKFFLFNKEKKTKSGYILKSNISNNNQNNNLKEKDIKDNLNNQTQCEENIPKLVSSNIKLKKDIVYQNDLMEEIIDENKNNIELLNNKNESKDNNIKSTNSSSVKLSKIKNKASKKENK